MIPVSRFGRKTIFASSMSIKIVEFLSYRKKIFNKYSNKNIYSKIIELSIILINIIIL